MASKWRQISGDVNWSDYGIVLAKDIPSAEQVELVRIEPWLEHDSSAILTYGGLFIVDEATFDYDDLDSSRKDVKSAMQTVGMDQEDYDKLEPVHKAEVYASTHGYGGEGRTTSDLVKALPDRPEDIEFFHGKETVESVRAAEADQRRAALDKLFDTSFDFGEMPSDDAIEFAVEGGFVQELDGNDVAGYGYAVLVADDAMPTLTNGRPITLEIEDADDFKVVVWNLANASKMDFAELDAKKQNKVRDYLGMGYPNMDDEDLHRMATELGESAGELAVKMMETVGFTWR